MCHDAGWGLLYHYMLAPIRWLFPMQWHSEEPGDAVSAAKELLAKLRPLSVVEQLTISEQGSGSRYMTHPLMRAVAADMLAAGSPETRVGAYRAFANFMLACRLELRQLGDSPEALVAAQQLLSDELANFRELAHALVEHPRRILDPQHLEPWVGLAEALIKHGQFTEGEQLREAILKALGPNHFSFSSTETYLKAVQRHVIEQAERLAAEKLARGLLEAQEPLHCYDSHALVNRSYQLKRWAWDVFVCHAGPDKVFALALKKRMPKGIRCFVDEMSLLPGSHAAHAMEDAVRSTQIAVVLLSQELFTREAPQQELRWILKYASSSRTNIVPVYLGLTHERCLQLAKAASLEAVCSEVAFLMCVMS